MTTSPIDSGAPGAGERQPAAPAPAPALAGAAADWALYADWCSATGRTPGETGWADLAAFLTEVPATVLVQQRRTRHLRPLLGLGTGGLPRPTVRLRSRIGSPWATYPDALAAVRHEWWPEGVAARRDALIIVLIARGVSRARISRLRPSDVTAFQEFAVDDLVLDGHSDPVLCPRCALVRWLQILYAYRDRSGHDIEELLTTARVHAKARHDCLEDVGEGWHTVPRLLPAIDQHGALHLGPPLTPRALTGILARRFTPQPQPMVVQARASQEDSGLQLRGSGRPTREQQDEIGRLYDQIADSAEALTARVLRLLDEAETSDCT